MKWLQRIKMRRWLDKHWEHGGIAASLFPDEHPRRTEMRCKCGSKLWL